MKICDFEISKVIEKLGYNGECKYYNRDGKLRENRLADDYIVAPRLDDVIYFLRDKYGLVISTSYIYSAKSYFSRIDDIVNHNTCVTYYTDEVPVYEDSLELAIKKSIQIIKEINERT